MVELGELEESHEAFAKRKVRVVVISNDAPQAAQKTQAKFPHLTVVSDADQNMAKALQVIEKGVGPDRSDTNAPTTFLLDGAGTVRWLFRPTHFITRLPADELLAAIDQNLLKK